jgi:Uma2 family endonuclease
MGTKPLEEQFAGVSELGIRVERVGGLTVWEAQPVFLHQTSVYRIQTSIRQGVQGACGCVHVADCTLAFPDGSLKRPDISVFCRVPDEEESAVTLLPEAVIEVISKDYEAKDYDVGVPFYLSAGIKDVITFDPRSGDVRHYRPDGMKRYTSPREISMACGCICTV